MDLFHTGYALFIRRIQQALKPNFSRHWGNWLLAPVVAFMAGFLPVKAFSAVFGETCHYFGMYQSWHVAADTYAEACAAVEGHPSGPFAIDSTGTCRSLAKNTSGQALSTLWPKRSTWGTPDKCPMPPPCPAGQEQNFQGYAPSEAACLSTSGTFGYQGCQYQVGVAISATSPVTCQNGAGTCFNEGRYLCTFSSTSTGQESDAGPIDWPDEGTDPDGGDTGTGGGSDNSDGTGDTGDGTGDSGDGTGGGETDGSDTTDTGDGDTGDTGGDSGGETGGDTDTGDTGGNDGSSGSGDTGDTGTGSGDGSGDPDAGDTSGGDTSGGTSGGSSSGGTSGSDGSGGDSSTDGGTGDAGTGSGTGTSGDGNGSGTDGNDPGGGNDGECDPATQECGGCDWEQFITDGCTGKTWDSESAETALEGFAGRVAGSPIMEAAGEIGGGTVSGTCPTLSINAWVINASTDIHCQVIGQNKGILGAAMLAVYALVAVRIVLSA